MERFTLTLVLTHACDLACAYCSAGPKDGRRLDEALGQRAIDRALATLGGGGSGDGGFLDLGFFGGEPLLEWPLARRLLAFARARAGERGTTVGASLTTNGSRVDELVARELVAEEVDVSLSLDGLPEVHDAERRTAGGAPSSARTLAAFDNLAALGRPPRIVSVVRPSNVEHLARGARFLADRGARVLHPSLDYRARWSGDAIARLERVVGALGDLYRERSPVLSISWIESKLAALGGMPTAACGFGRGEVAVAPSGRLYPCERLVEDDRAGAWAMGHVLDAAGPFPPHPASCVPPEDSECGACSARFACSNACACQNLARTSLPDRPDGLVCALEQASLDAAASVLAAIA